MIKQNVNYKRRQADQNLKLNLPLKALRFVCYKSLFWLCYNAVSEREWKEMEIVHWNNKEHIWEWDR